MRASAATRCWLREGRISRTNRRGRRARNSGTTRSMRCCRARPSWRRRRQPAGTAGLRGFDRDGSRLASAPAAPTPKRHYDEVYLLRWQAGPVARSTLCRRCRRRLPTFAAPDWAASSTWREGRTIRPRPVRCGPFGRWTWRPRSRVGGNWSRGRAGRILAVAGVQAGRFICSAERISNVDAGGKPLRRYLTDAYRFTPGQGWQTIAAPPRPMVAAPSPAMAIGQSHLLVLSGDDGTKSA